MGNPNGLLHAAVDDAQPDAQDIGLYGREKQPTCFMGTFLSSLCSVVGLFHIYIYIYIYLILFCSTSPCGSDREFNGKTQPCTWFTRGMSASHGGLPPIASVASQRVAPHPEVRSVLPSGWTGRGGGGPQLTQSPE